MSLVGRDISTGFFKTLKAATPIIIEDESNTEFAIEKCENKKIPTQLRETVRFLDISMDRTFIFDFSPYKSRIMSSTLNFTWYLYIFGN